MASEQEVRSSQNPREWIRNNITNRATCGFYYITIVAAVDCLVALCLAFVVYYNNIESENPPPINNILCVPCVDLSLHVDEDFVNLKPFDVYRLDVDRTQCCSENVSSLVHLKVERVARLSLANGFAEGSLPMECGQRKPPSSGHLSGKVVLDPQSQPKGAFQSFELTLFQVNVVESSRLIGQGPEDAVQWNETSPGSYFGPGVYYKNGRISVRQNQYYFVYSQITFRQQLDLRPDGTPSERPVFSHYLFRNVRSGEQEYSELIMQTSEKLCNLRKKNDTSTTFLGSDFFLRGDHEILVKVSHPDRVVSGFLGVYRV